MKGYQQKKTIYTYIYDAYRSSHGHYLYSLDQGSPYRLVWKVCTSPTGDRYRWYISTTSYTMCWYTRYGSIQLGTYRTNNWLVHQYRLVRRTMVLMPTYVNSMKRTRFMTPYSWDITAYISLEKHLANVSYVLQIRMHRTILHAKLDKMILQYLPYVVRHMPFQVGGMKQIRNIYLGTNHQRV